MELIVKNRKIAFTFLVLCALVLTGCQKGDGDSDFGFTYVYIPQATYTGTNNFYPIPGGTGDNSSLNYKIEKQGNAPVKLNVLLGVLRSGKISNASGLTVDVGVLNNETNKMIASGEISNALALPSDVYTMPDKVSIEADKNTGSFYMSVDISKLMAGTYNGKNLVVVVGISNPNPAVYELSDSNTSVTVIIDVDEIRSVLYDN